EHECTEITDQCPHHVRSSFLAATGSLCFEIPYYAIVNCLRVRFPRRWAVSATGPRPAASALSVVAVFGIGILGLVQYHAKKVRVAGHQPLAFLDLVRPRLSATDHQENAIH